jgi:hypothetical protein
MSPDGRAGWYAYRPDGSRISGENERASKTLPDGSVVRLMGEHSVTVPLWSERGLMFSEPENLMRELGVSPALAADLEAWANAWQTHAGEPAHDAEAAALVRRLKRETEYRFRVLYHP